MRSGTTDQRLRASVSAQRREQRGSANRLRDGLSLAPLRSTSGPPAKSDEPNAATANPDRGRRSASLFDAPNSGRNLVNRLRAQIRPSSPLNALGTDASAAATPADTFGSLATTGVAGRGPAAPSWLADTREGRQARDSLATANALRSSLRGTFLRSDGRSRLLLSLGNANRSDGGFGLAAITRSAFDLLG